MLCMLSKLIHMYTTLSQNSIYKSTVLKNIDETNYLLTYLVLVRTTGNTNFIVLLVVFVNRVCDFNGIVFTEKGVCRIVFKT